MKKENIRKMLVCSYATIFGFATFSWLIVLLSCSKPVLIITGHERYIEAIIFPVALYIIFKYGLSKTKRRK